MYINISTYVTTGNRKVFERWTKLNNLKEAARTFNYLLENNLLNYEDFQKHLSDVDTSIKAVEQRIVQINSELITQKVIQKYCDSYRLCRKVIEDCKSDKNQKPHLTNHQAEYQLHDALKKELQDLGVKKSQALIKSRSKLKILNLNRLLPSGKNSNYKKKQKTQDIIQPLLKIGFLSSIIIIYFSIWYPDLCLIYLIQYSFNNLFICNKSGVLSCSATYFFVFFIHPACSLILLFHLEIIKLFVHL